MRLVAVFVAVCALTQTAVAQTSDCKSISDARLRLGCYDRAAPPAASAEKAIPATAEKTVPAATPAEKSAAAKPAAVKPSKLDNSKYVDTISAEDALMNARLKNICRGC
jgi:hypothetical protein